MVKSGSYLDAKRQKEKQAREAAAYAYESPAGRESTPIELSGDPSFTADKYLDMMEANGKRVKPFAYRVRREKRANSRPLPSAHLTLSASTLSEETRRALLDKIATLTDEHVFGRSDMCFQSSALLQMALVAMGYQGVAKQGTADYRRTSGKWMTWEHAWVELGDELIDGNVDSLRENPRVGQGALVNSYWGSGAALPDDRRLRPARPLDAKHYRDPDVEMWWDDLRNWLEQGGLIKERKPDEGSPEPSQQAAGA